MLKIIQEILNSNLSEELKQTQIESIITAFKSGGEISKFEEGGKYFSDIEYEIKSGDTLSQIAEKQGIKLSNLLQYNNIADANKIKVGQKIKIPKFDTDSYIQSITKPLETENVWDKTKDQIKQTPVETTDMMRGWYPEDLTMQVDPERLLKQMYKESTFNPNAGSEAGAKGLMQLMPNTIADYEKATGKKVNVNDPQQNIAVAIWQLNRLGEAEWVNKYEGMTTNPQVRLAKIYAGYNHGPGNAIKELTRLKEKGYDIYNSLDWIDAYSVPETRDYMRKLLGMDEKFNEEYENNKKKGEQYRKFFREGGSLKDKVNITIGKKQYIVKIAETKDEQTVGLSKTKELPEKEGMLFTYDEPQSGLWYTMKDTSIDLDIIFINEDQEVTSVNSVKAHDEAPIYDKENNAQYVLEVNINSGIKVGDELEFDEDDKNYTMKILAPDGSTQMKLEGGERIVSRRETKILISKAKKVYFNQDKSNYESLCKNLGKYMVKVLNKQDNRDPEYVQLPS